MNPLIQRNALPLTQQTVATSPVTVISGPRQVGKSTLMRMVLQTLDPEIPVRTINLDSAVDRKAAQTDPDGFADQLPNGLLAIDEIQRIPELLLSIKASLEKNRRPGRFIVTGSSNIMSLKGGEESLAGRAQTINLRGISRGELEGRSEDFAALAWSDKISETVTDDESYSRHDYLAITATPTYPELFEMSSTLQRRWYDNYINRVLSKDIEQISGVQFPLRLEKLLNLFATRNASEFVSAHVGRELDVPARSLPPYVAALTDVFFIDAVPSWGNNLSKRVISRSKISLQDSGMAAHLCGIDVDGMERDISSSVTGGIVEGFVVEELFKQREWSEIDYRIHHFRDRSGHEVDIVLENRKREIVGIEVKAAVTVQGSDFSGLNFLKEQLGDRFVNGILLYTGTRAVPFGPRMWALPLSALWSY